MKRGSSLISAVDNRHKPAMPNMFADNSWTGMLNMDSEHEEEEVGAKTFLLGKKRRVDEKQQQQQDEDVRDMEIDEVTGKASLNNNDISSGRDGKDAKQATKSPSHNNDNDENKMDYSSDPFYGNLEGLKRKPYLSSGWNLPKSLPESKGHGGKKDKEEKEEENVDAFVPFGPVPTLGGYLNKQSHAFKGFTPADSTESKAYFNDLLESKVGAGSTGGYEKKSGGDFDRSDHERMPGNSSVPMSNADLEAGINEIADRVAVVHFDGLQSAADSLYDVLDSMYDEEDRANTIHTREQVILSIMYGNTTTDGERREKLIQKTLNSFGLIRTKQQVQFHAAGILASLQHIHKETFERSRIPIMEKKNLKELRTEILVVTPRRYGKTTMVAMLAAAFLLCIPGIRIAIFSTGRRASQSLMDLIIYFISKIPGGRERICLKNQERLCIAATAGTDGKGGLARASKNLVNDPSTSVLMSLPASETVQDSAIADSAVFAFKTQAQNHIRSAVEQTTQSVSYRTGDGIATSEPMVVQLFGKYLKLIGVSQATTNDLTRQHMDRIRDISAKSTATPDETAAASAAMITATAAPLDELQRFNADDLGTLLLTAGFDTSDGKRKGNSKSQAAAAQQQQQHQQEIDGIDKFYEMELNDMEKFHQREALQTISGLITSDVIPQNDKKLPTDENAAIMDAVEAFKKDVFDVVKNSQRVDNETLELLKVVENSINETVKTSGYIPPSQQQQSASAMNVGGRYSLLQTTDSGNGAYDASVTNPIDLLPQQQQQQQPQQPSPVFSMNMPASDCLFVAWDSVFGLQTLRDDPFYTIMFDKVWELTTLPETERHREPALLDALSVAVLEECQKPPEVGPETGRWEIGPAIQFCVAVNDCMATVERSALVLKSGIDIEFMSQCVVFVVTHLMFLTNIAGGKNQLAAWRDPETGVHLSFVLRVLACNLLWGRKPAADHIAAHENALAAAQEHKSGAQTAAALLWLNKLTLKTAMADAMYNRSGSSSVDAQLYVHFPESLSGLIVGLLTCEQRALELSRVIDRYDNVTRGPQTAVVYRDVSIAYTLLIKSMEGIDTLNDLSDSLTSEWEAILKDLLRLATESSEVNKMLEGSELFAVSARYMRNAGKETASTTEQSEEQTGGISSTSSSGSDEEEEEEDQAGDSDTDEWDATASTSLSLIPPLESFD